MPAPPVDRGRTVQVMVVVDSHHDYVCLTKGVGGQHTSYTDSDISFDQFNKSV